MALVLKKEIKLLARHSFVYSIGNFMQKIIALLLLPVYTRFLSPNDYGLKEMVGLTTDMIAILIATAMSGAFYRFYYQYQSREDKNEVISTTLITIAGVGLFFIGCLSIFARQLAQSILNDHGLYHFFIISFITLWFQALNDIGNSIMKANMQSIKFVCLSCMKMVLAIALNIYFVCFLRIGVLGILVSSLITAIVMAAIITVPILMKVGIRFSIEKTKEMLHFGIPLVPSQLGAFMVHLSDRFFLKEYCSIADVGLYSLGYRLGGFPGVFISDPFNQVFQARRLEVYKQPEAEYIFGRVFTYFLLVMFFAGLIVSTLARELLMIMADKQFWSASQIIPIIVMATTVFSFHYHLNIGIIVSKKTKYLAYINFSNGVFVIILNFALIPPYGVYGAAYATLIAFIYKIAMTYYFSSRFFKIHFEVVRVFKLILTALLVYALAMQLQVDSILVSFASKFMIVLIGYPILLLVMRFFTEAEKEKIYLIIRTRRLHGIT